MARRPNDPPAEPELPAEPEQPTEPEQHAESVAAPPASTTPPAAATEQYTVPVAEQREVVATAAEPRRRWSGWSFAAGAGLVAAVVLLAGGTSWVVARAAAATPEAVVAPAAPGSGSAMKGHQQKAGARAVRGSISAIDGPTWTVTSRKGATVTVTVSATTQYGRPGSPAAVSDFRAGQSVVVVGTGKDGRITAKRIIAAPAPSPAATPTT